MAVFGMREAATAEAASGPGGSVSAPNNDDAEDSTWDGRDRASGPRDRSLNVVSMEGDREMVGGVGILGILGMWRFKTYLDG